MYFAHENGRVIGAPDKLFGVSQLAKERIAQKGKENVINTTLGVLLNEEGNLVVLESVMDAIKDLSPEDYAAYAPILGLPEYLEAVKEAVFLGDVPAGIAVEACYTPGVTGAIRNAVSAYTVPGDQVLTSNWHWAPYNAIAKELGRSVQTYELFDADWKFNAEAFDAGLAQVLAGQEQTLVIINTPAHNPTGYTFTLEDWDRVQASCAKHPEKKIVILADIAYLDFAGDAKAYRQFLPKLAAMPENVLSLLAFSASKGFTMYGMRCGALICMAPSAEIAKEFKDTMQVECRASWSNGNRAAMQVIADIFADSALKKKVFDERDHYLAILKERGQVFTQEAEKAGLVICPYDSGFFVTVPCGDADTAERVGRALQDMDVFAVVLGSGVRITIAANTMDECRRLPAMVQKAVEQSR